MSTRSRPVRLALPLALLALCLVWPAVAHAQQVVFLVRHAERADTGGMQPEADPLLSEAGEARAAKLATMLGDSGITRIFATEYLRTQNTGKPLAAKLGITVETAGARETAALVERLKSDHADEIVLLVGHSNTVPALIKAYGGPDVTIGENEYDNLFVIVPATGAFTRIRF